jgi:hypothetical protein
MSSPSQQKQPKSTSLLLWVFVASDDRIGELHHVYARTETAARQQTMMSWIAEQAMLGRKDIEVKHWPGGFLAGYRTYLARQYTSTARRKRATACHSRITVK